MREKILHCCSQSQESKCFCDLLRICCSSKEPRAIPGTLHFPYRRLTYSGEPELWGSLTLTEAAVGHPGKGGSSRVVIREGKTKIEWKTEGGKKAERAWGGSMPFPAILVLTEHTEGQVAGCVCSCYRSGHQCHPEGGCRSWSSHNTLHSILFLVGLATPTFNFSLMTCPAFVFSTGASAVSLQLSALVGLLAELWAPHPHCCWLILQLSLFLSFAHL